MVCNLGMKTHHPDKILIDRLGGPAEVARILGYDTTKHGVQKVWNWTRRGIPWRVKAQNQKLFGIQSKQARVA